MRNLLLIVLLVAAASRADSAQLLVSSAPAPGQLGVNGFKTFTLSMLTEGTESFRGVDASFYGAMNQLTPAGQTIVFNDFGSWFLFGIDPLADSHFLFQSPTILQIGGQESPSLLKAAISGLADNGLSNPALFAQIVALDGDVTYDLSFDIGLPDPVDFSGMLGIPEPTTFVLAGLAMFGVAVGRR